jgi:Fic family protein
MRNIYHEIDLLQKEINNYRPLSSTLLNQIKEYYKIGLTYSSNALEGNTLSESETKIVLEEGITIGGKPLKDHFEAVGHAAAYDYIYTICNQKALTEDHIKHLHKLFYHHIDEDEGGRYRKTKAIITGSKYPLPKPEELLSYMKEMILHFKETRETKHPVEAAALLHKEFVFIHPFADGNGRVARLLMNLVLLQEGYNIATIPPITRNQYIEALELAHTDDRDFIDFIARMVRETQKDYLRLFLN